jgi:hypothetical protein
MTDISDGEADPGSGQAPAFAAIPARRTAAEPISNRRAGRQAQLEAVRACLYNPPLAAKLALGAG